MKKILLTAAACVMSLVLWTGCGDSDDDIPGSDPNQSVPDPEGTILISVRNGNNGGGGFTPVKNGSAIRIDAADNFYGSNWQFTAIGEVKGLGNVVKIPGSGWTGETSVRPGYGYVAAYTGANSVSYTRIYVEEYMIATTGGVIGAEIRYQTPFGGTAKEIKFSQDKDSVAFDVKGGFEEITLAEPVPYSVTTDNSWFTVTVKASSFEIRAQTIPQDSVRKGKITIQSPGLKTKTVTVTQGLLTGQLEVSPTALKLSTKPETAYLNVRSDSRWKIECEDTWCTFTPSEGMGNVQVKVTTTESDVSRSANARFYIGENRKATVNISQAYRLAGEGTAVSPYQIKTANDLAEIKSYLAEPAHFELMNNIDLTAFLSRSEAGWNPIGDKETPFNGYFHGNGHVIKGLWMDDPTLEYAGLFGYAEMARFDQLGIETSSKGITGGNYVGALCGYNSEYSSDSGSKISQCYSKGSVTGKSSGKCYAGAIIGYLSSNYGAIDNCYSEASVHVEASQAYVGGISGFVNDLISSCYSVGRLSAQVGYGEAVIGGIVPGGYNIRNSYYDSQTTGIEGGRTTAEMKQLSTYSGWDFNTVWFMEGVSYPGLRCFEK